MFQGIAPSGEEGQRTAIHTCLGLISAAPSSPRVLNVCSAIPTHRPQASIHNIGRGAGQAGQTGGGAALCGSICGGCLSGGAGKLMEAYAWLRLA